MTRDALIADRRELLAEIVVLEQDLAAYERRYGLGVAAAERARVSRVRADVAIQLCALLAASPIIH